MLFSTLTFDQRRFPENHFTKWFPTDKTFGWEFFRFFQNRTPGEKPKNTVQNWIEKKLFKHFLISFSVSKVWAKVVKLNDTKDYSVYKKRFRKQKKADTRAHFIYRAQLWFKPWKLLVMTTICPNSQVTPSLKCMGP